MGDSLYRTHSLKVTLQVPLTQFRPLVYRRLGPIRCEVLRSFNLIVGELWYDTVLKVISSFLAVTYINEVITIAISLQPPLVRRFRTEAFYVLSIMRVGQSGRTYC
jgi:hypothetical protein